MKLKRGEKVKKIIQTKGATYLIIEKGGKTIGLGWLEKKT